MICFKFNAPIPARGRHIDSDNTGAGRLERSADRTTRRPDRGAATGPTRVTAVPGPARAGPVPDWAGYLISTMRGVLPPPPPFLGWNGGGSWHLVSLCVCVCACVCVCVCVRV